MLSPINLLFALLGISSSQTDYQPLFWDELEELLGPIWQPIVGPLFDVLRDESTRLIMLTTAITVCIFIVVITFVVYEVPSLINWFIGGASMTTLEAKPPIPRKKILRDVRRPRSTPAPVKEPEPTPVPLAAKGVDVRSIIEKNRDEIILWVDVANNSDHRIEMVVVDIDLPIGIDITTGSFRMQRIGTIDSGDSARAMFKIKQIDGALSDITGHVEFMSSSYEITQVIMPSPEEE